MREAYLGLNDEEISPLRFRSGRNDVVVRLRLAMVGFIAADLRFIRDEPPTGTK